jgi:hypothetical protein
MYISQDSFSAPDPLRYLVLYPYTQRTRASRAYPDSSMSYATGTAVTLVWGLERADPDDTALEHVERPVGSDTEQLESTAVETLQNGMTMGEVSRAAQFERAV